jgi:site-specific DNA-methyltransferase (adenine-specific)
MNSQTYPAVHSFLDRITEGDCLSLLRCLPDNSVDLVVTDPPYLIRHKDRDGRKIINDDNGRWVYPAFAELYRVLKPDRWCICFYAWNRADRFLSAWRECGFFPVGHFVFVKAYASFVNSTRMRHEQAYLLVKGHPLKPEFPPDDVVGWQYSGNKLHPTQKPVSALTPLVLAYSEKNDIVLDPFAGSGTTGIAARQTGRHFILFEKDEQYFQAAQKRLAEDLPQN